MLDLTKLVSFDQYLMLKKDHRCCFKHVVLVGKVDNLVEAIEQHLATQKVCVRLTFHEAEVEVVLVAAPQLQDLDCIHD